MLKFANAELIFITITRTDGFARAVMGRHKKAGDFSPACSFISFKLVLILAH